MINPDKTKEINNLDMTVKERDNPDKTKEINNLDLNLNRHESENVISQDKTVTEHDPPGQAILVLT